MKNNMQENDMDIKIKFGVVGTDNENNFAATLTINSEEIGDSFRFEIKDTLPNQIQEVLDVFDNRRIQNEDFDKTIMAYISNAKNPSIEMISALFAIREAFQTFIRTYFTLGDCIKNNGTDEEFMRKLNDLLSGEE
jgi:hypothetical protein